ncbi:hypothetical protein Taro_027728 [Colocasia esculenta]|uniref:Uncharacterized protein n=1 Tax=Colocasia esculenta TaxID=4460 RepID=A0A843VPM4_COLES|nr:hypothetical protein [Colocasia esculenta]
MVRFSLSEGQGEKRRKVLVLPASFSSTSPSAPCLIFASEGEDDDEDDYHYPELDAEQPKEVQAGAGDDGGRAGPSSEGGSKVGCCGGKEAVTVTIDPDALDCPICCETLSPPIFQTQNYDTYPMSSWCGISVETA